jgi:glycosyltransferase involved in cell wall biosynthesis
MKPVVLFLSPVPDFKGGAERSLLDLIANPQIEPLLVVPAEGPLSMRASDSGISVEVLRFGSISEIRRPFRLSDGIGVLLRLISVARRLVHISRARGVDIIHSNGLKAHVVAVTARCFGGPPAVTHIRDIANTTTERMVWRALQLLSDQMILVSRACWPSGTLPSNVHVVHNGFQIPACASARSSGSGLVAGFVGRIHPAKGLHVLLPWIATARQGGCQLKLIVRGAFAKETPRYQREIARQISVLGLSDHVVLEGFVSDPDKVYAGIDIVCVPSVTPDPLPRSVMEAMGRGLVVVAAPTGGIVEMIVDGDNGFLVASEREFVDVMNRLLERPELVGKISGHARERCAAMFSLERLHESVLRIYALMRPRDATVAQLTKGRIS